MGYLTKFGSQFGLIPQVLGRIFFVAPSASYTVEGRTYIASDDNDGLSPERAVLTVNRAIALATASVGDAIVLLNGTHTVTSTVAINKAGLKFWGVASGPGTANIYQPASILTSTGMSDELLNITVGGTEIGYLTLRPTTAYSAISFQTTSAIDVLHIHHCHFDLYTPVVSRSTIGIDFSNRAGGNALAKISGTASAITHVLIEDCTFESDGAQGAAIETATVYATIRNCRVHGTTGTWATPFRIASGTDNTLIDNVVFTTTATMGVCIDGTDADTAYGLVIRQCGFPPTGALTNSTRPVDYFDTNEAHLIESYQAGDATAVTAIT